MFAKLKKPLKSESKLTEIGMKTLLMYVDE